jgi:hypothetical protein
VHVRVPNGRRASARAVFPKFFMIVKSFQFRETDKSSRSWNRSPGEGWERVGPGEHQPEHHQQSQAGARAHLAGSVLMGLPRPGGLDFAGAVGSGLSTAELRELTALLASVEQPVPPFTGPLPPAITRHARWARPVITAEVAYLERTPSGRLRQPVWRGLLRGL